MRYLLSIAILLSVLYAYQCFQISNEEYCKRDSKITLLNVTRALEVADEWVLNVDGKAVIEQFITPANKVSPRQANVISFNVRWGYMQNDVPDIKFTYKIEEKKFLMDLSGISKQYGGGDLAGCEPHYRITVTIPETIAESVASKDFSIVINDIGGIAARKLKTNVLSSCSVNGTVCPSCCSGNGYCSAAGCTCKITHTGAACNKQLEIEKFKPAIAYKIWQPHPKYDTCSKELHETYAIIGPDGKIYNTWHPPVHHFADGSNCTFGHEHGQNPMLSRRWPVAVEHYSYNKDFLSNSGLPFGFVNEQMEEARTEKAVNYSRHEDHVGHKIIWEHEVHIDWSIAPDGTNRPWTGFTCDVLTKYHQGTHSADAFGNNLHEILHFGKCNHTSKDPEYLAQDVRLATMGRFGKPGEFNSFQCPQFLSRLVPVGFHNSSKDYPGTNIIGGRAIGTRECADSQWLVPEKSFSGFFYEVWGTHLNMYYPKGQNQKEAEPALYLPIAFAVFNPGRFFDPGRPNNLTYTSELCFERKYNEKGQELRARGGACDFVRWRYDEVKKPYDPLSPDSLIIGNSREVYFKHASFSNKYKTPYLFTDLYGANLVPRPENVKVSNKGQLFQYISTTGGKWIDYGVDFPDAKTGKLVGKPTEPTALGKYTNNGGLREGVHLPN